MAQTYALHQAFTPAGHMTILQLFLVNWCWLDFLHLCIVAAFWWIHHFVVWVLFFLFRFWTYSGILVHSVTELYIELGPLCCLHIVSFFLLALDGGVRCFWWWRDNTATLHFSYLICFLIRENLVFVMIRTRPVIFSRQMCRNFRLHASTALSRQCYNGAHW